MDKTEKQKLAEDNHKLIYSWLNSRHLNVDEWYDIAALGYMKAVNTYSGEFNSSFSSWAYKLMDQSRALNLRKYLNTISLSGGEDKQFAVVLSLDKEFKRDEDDGNFYDITDANIDIEKLTSYCIDFKSKLKYMTLTDLKIIMLKLYGLSNKSVSVTLGFSRNYIQKRMSNINLILTRDYTPSANLLTRLSKVRNTKEYQITYKNVERLIDSIYYS